MSNFDYQESIINSVSLNKGHTGSLIQLPTGTGKTRIMLEVTRNILANNGRVVIVASSRYAIFNVWIKELKKWNIDTGKFVSIYGNDSPPTRKKWYQIAEQEGYSIIITPATLSNDVVRYRFLDLSKFEAIFIDEAHHAVAKDISGWRRNLNYCFLYRVHKENIIGSTINFDDQRISALKKTLDLKTLTDQRAETQKVITRIITVSDPVVAECSISIGQNIRKALRVIERVLGRAVDFRNVLYLKKRIDEISRKYSLSPEQTEQLDKACAALVHLIAAQTDLLEDNLPRNEVITNSKTKKITEVVSQLAAENKKVLLATKRRRKAKTIKLELEKTGIKCGLLMGGTPDPQRVLDECLNNGTNVLVITPVGIESLNLIEFDALVHISPYSDPFRRAQLRGRIRGGDEYYIVYDKTPELVRLEEFCSKQDNVAKVNPETDRRETENPVTTLIRRP